MRRISFTVIYLSISLVCEGLLILTVGLFISKISSIEFITLIVGSLTYIQEYSRSWSGSIISSSSLIPEFVIIAVFAIIQKVLEVLQNFGFEVILM